MEMCWTFELCEVYVRCVSVQLTSIHPYVGSLQKNWKQQFQISIQFFWELPIQTHPNPLKLVVFSFLIIFVFNLLIFVSVYSRVIPMGSYAVVMVHRMELIIAEYLSCCCAYTIGHVGFLCYKTTVRKVEHF